MTCKYFPPFHGLSFHHLDDVLLIQKFQILMKSNLSFFFFLLLLETLVSYTRSQKLTPTLLSKNVIVLSFNI